MPKHQLIFTLPEEQDELEKAMKGTDYYLVVSSTQEYIRNRLKYESQNMTEDRIAVFKEIQDFIQERLTERNLEGYFG